jgi:predicted RNA-binding protein with TRAM domain
MITLTLSQGIPKSIRRAALEPGEQDLRNVEDDIKHGDGDQTAADFGIFVK